MDRDTAQVSGDQVPDLAQASCEIVLCFSATALQNEKKSLPFLTGAMEGPKI